MLFMEVDGASELRLGSPVFTEVEIREVEGFDSVEECSGASTSLVEVAISARVIDVCAFVEETKEQSVLLIFELTRRRP